MSTRAVVAVPYRGSWRGRYTHWDGYPEHHVPTLLSIVQRDGLARAVQVLTVEHFGWSSLDHTEQRSGPGSLGHRSVLVPGYGQAYTAVEARPDDWIHAADVDTWCEYAYLLSPDGLVVLGEGQDRDPFDRVGDDGTLDDLVWTELGRCSWTTPPHDAHRRLVTG